MTDNQEEMFDVVDKNDRVIRTATRGEVHKNPALVHRSIGILVFRGDQLYLHKRSDGKDVLPGTWTCSVTGHVDSGETYDQAAERELREELGVAKKGEITEIAETVLRYPWETERMRFYRYDTTDELKPDSSEIAEGKYFDVTPELIETILLHMETTPCLKYICEEYLRGKAEARR